MNVLPVASYSTALLRALMLLMMLTAGAACGGGPLLSSVALSTDVISPNGSSVGDAIISYHINSPATVSIVFTDAAGKEYTFRRREPRVPGDYAARFGGTYAPDDAKPDRRVLPNGQYTYVVKAEAASGATSQAQGTLEVRDADVTPPLVQDVSALPEVFSPNGDNEDDDTLVNYTLTKEARVTITVDGPDGNSYLLEPETEKTPRLYSLRWDGTAGDRLLRDGAYTLHIRSRDAAGNVSDYSRTLTLEGAGRPKLEITSVRFFPLALPVGGNLNVEITVKNTGESPLKSLGPEPGTPYDTIENFLKFRGQDGQPQFFERPGVWRVGIMWQQAASPYPVRWGWGDQPLLPGQEVTISGSIKLVAFQTAYVQFWANVIQEGVGYGDPVGHKRIAISY